MYITQFTVFANEPFPGRNYQVYDLYASDSSSDPGWDTSSYTLIANVDMGGADPGGTYFSGTTIKDDGGAMLGTYRWLLWDERTPGDGGSYCEFDVIGTIVPKGSVIMIR